MKLLYTILFALSILFLACNTGRPHLYNKQMRQSYIQEFKLTYFKKLLQKGFNGSAGINDVLKADRSGYGEIILGIRDYQIIDSVVELEHGKIIQDSIAIQSRHRDGKGGKRVLDIALHCYNSNWLDSLAKACYLNKRQYDQGNY